MPTRFLFKVHAWAGLLSGLFVLLMSLSGAILVFHDELDKVRPGTGNATSQAILPVDSCYHIIQQAFPAARISSCELPDGKESPYAFSLYDTSFEKGREALQVFLHPQTGAIIKKRSSHGLRDHFMGWLSAFHSSFLLGRVGEWLLGFFAIIFLFSLFSGVILYRKKILSVLRFRKEVFRKKNLHQLIGVYALLFNLVIGISGFWMQRYVFTKEFYGSWEYSGILVASPPLFFSLDSSLKESGKQLPDFTCHVIYFAQNKNGKTAIYGSRSSNSFIHSRNLADVIFLDSTGKTVKTAFVKDIDAGSRYDIINAQVHYGQYGGMVVKIVYGLLGLTGGLLSITGFIMWFKRRGIKRKSPVHKIVL